MAYVELWLASPNPKPKPNSLVLVVDELDVHEY